MTRNGVARLEGHVFEFFGGGGWRGGGPVVGGIGWVAGRFDQAETDEAGCDRAGGAFVDGGDFRYRLLGGEGVAQALLFFGGPQPGGRGTDGAGGFAGRLRSFEGFEGEEEGAHHVGLLVGTVRRKEDVGEGVNAVGQAVENFDGFGVFHGA